MAAERIPVLIAAGGAGWEGAAVQLLSAAAPALVLLKRCVDLTDLLATASTGQARVAVLDGGLSGLDADSVALLRRAGVGAVLVDEIGDAAAAGVGGALREKARRLGIDHVVSGAELRSLPKAVLAADPGRHPVADRHEPDEETVESPAGREPARLVAVWGPTGGPGRTTVAVNLAAELAHREHETLLVDVDGFGGAVAQHLGVLDEMSGLLAAARMANGGRLDVARLAGVARQVGPALRVLTGLPRSDRWAEVRDSAFERLLDTSRGLGRFVVLDTSFSLEQDPQAAFGAGGPQRNGMTLTSLETADEIIVVGAADPVGLARLARGLVDLIELVPGSTVRIAVNRTRPALGWGEQEIRTMVEGFVTPASIHFLPDDRPAADRALVAGRSLVETGDSGLRRGIASIADAVTGVAGRSRRRGGRRPSRVRR